MDKKNQDKNIESLTLNYVFYNKPIYLYVFKKVTKIASAVYIVTDNLKDEEPIKWSLRKECSESVTFINYLKDIEVSKRGLFSHLITMRGLLDLGRISKNISDMNYCILEKEISDLISILNTDSVSEVSLDKDLFFVQREDVSDSLYFKDGLLNKTAESLNKKDSNKGHYKSHINDFYNQSSVYVKKPILETGQGGVSIGHTKLNREDKNELKNNRREQIVNIIKVKGPSTIKDITSVIKDCSEKTIQRELITLLSLGQIKKTGERRWSRYSVS